MKTPTKAQVKETAKKAANNTANFLTNPTVLKLAAVGVGGILIYKIANSITAGATPKEVVKDILGVDEDLNFDNSTTGLQPTITLQQSKIYAQQLLEAANASEYGLWGTDDPTILEIFKKINSEDFKLIFKSFGIPLYNGYNSPPDSWFWQQFDNFTERNLVYWLHSELEDSKGDEVYDVVKAVIEEAGFVFKH